jgi:hypothetical protein
MLANFILSIQRGEPIHLELTSDSGFILDMYGKRVEPDYMHVQFPDPALLIVTGTLLVEMNKFELRAEWTEYENVRIIHYEGAWNRADMLFRLLEKMEAHPMGGPLAIMLKPLLRRMVENG